jgi:hypothetical protein
MEIAAADRREWIARVLMGDGPLALSDATRDLNVFRDSCMDAVHLLSTSIRLLKGTDLHCIPVMMQRLVCVLDASHAAYSFHSAAMFDLLIFWFDNLFLLYTKRTITSKAVEASIHSVTQWLLAHDKVDPTKIASVTRTTTFIRDSMWAITHNDSQSLEQGIFWTTLICMVPYFWPEISARVCHMLLQPDYYVSSHILDHTWHFLLECAPYIRRNPTLMMKALFFSETWYLHLDMRLRLAVYLLRCGAVSSLPKMTESNQILHLLAVAAHDSVLAADILFLPAPIIDDLRSCGVKWPARAWEYEPLIDGQALISLASTSKGDATTHACGVHLWSTWQAAAQGVLTLYMIPDLARLTLAWM